jgi:peptidoglycan/LPS O-acetylase OafA/YrhL
MKWMNIYLIGYLVFLAGVTLALWKSGVIDQIGATWTAIGLVIAFGIGIMVSVANSGEKRTIEVDRS